MKVSSFKDFKIYVSLTILAVILIGQLIGIGSTRGGPMNVSITFYTTPVGIFLIIIFFFLDILFKENIIRYITLISEITFLIYSIYMIWFFHQANTDLVFNQKYFYDRFPPSLKDMIVVISECIFLVLFSFLRIRKWNKTTGL